MAEEPSVIIGASEDAPLHQVGPPARLSDGRFVVAQGGLSSQLDMFSAAGEPLGTIGRTGDGPGEFRLITSLTVDSSDSIYVFDRNWQRLTILSADGRYVRSVTSRLPSSAVGSEGLSSIERLSGDVWVVRTAPTLVNGPPHVIVRDTVAIGLVNGALDGFRMVTRLPGTMSTSSLVAGRRAFGTTPFSARAIVRTWGRCIYATATDEPRVTVFAADGTQVGSISEPFRARRTTKDDLAAFVEARVSSMSQRAAALQRKVLEDKAVPEMLPYISQLVLDEWGQLWVQEYQPPFGQQGSQWHVLSQIGEVLSIVEMPSSMTVYAIGRNGVLGTSVGEFGQHLVVLYPFVRRPPENARALAPCQR